MKHAAPVTLEAGNDTNPDFAKHFIYSITESKAKHAPRRRPRDPQKVLDEKQLAGSSDAVVGSGRDTSQTASCMIKPSPYEKTSPYARMLHEKRNGIHFR